MTPTRIALAILGCLALLAAVALRVSIAYLRRRTGFMFDNSAAFTVVDTDTAGAATSLLRDASLGLCGKPDYLLETDANGRRVLVPLEVKPKRNSHRLYDSDRIQVGAYLIALRGTFGIRASRLGYVRYSARTFEVVLTPGLESEVVQLLDALRRSRLLSDVHRSHNIPGRCRACPVRRSCNESLVR